MIYSAPNLAILTPNTSIQAITLTAPSDQFHLLSAGAIPLDFNKNYVGGLHNNFVLAAWTAYTVHACKDYRDQVDLFALPITTPVDATLVASLEDSTATAGRYSCYSEPIGLLVTDGTNNIMPFTVREGYIWFSIDDGLAILTGGGATTPTAVDLSTLVPAGTSSVILKARAANAGGTESATIYTYTGSVQYAHAVLHDVGVGNSPQEFPNLLCPIYNPATSVRYSLSGAMTTGLDILLKAVKLFE